MAFRTAAILGLLIPPFFTPYFPISLSVSISSIFNLSIQFPILALIAKHLSRISIHWHRCNFSWKFSLTVSCVDPRNSGVHSGQDVESKGGMEAFTGSILQSYKYELLAVTILATFMAALGQQI
ncbi:hypothetical protein BX600DRAFT_203292 [Xylariales sp. PMI_506]|nr:hypothetical protein BX600DRAFT_203292 [Xylariales sp. PMI_506]